jgi:hypothetical protein
LSASDVRKGLPRLIEGMKNSLLVVHDETAEDQPAAIQLLKPYWQAMELYGGERQPMWR